MLYFTPSWAGGGEAFGSEIASSENIRAELQSGRERPLSKKNVQDTFSDRVKNVISQKCMLPCHRAYNVNQFFSINWQFFLADPFCMIHEGPVKG